MKVGIDYTPAYEQGGGIGRYVRELIAALALEDQETDYHLFVAGAQARELPSPPAKNFSWKPTRLSPRWLARIWHRAHLPLPIEQFAGRVDLFHATDFVLPPTLRKTRTLLTVHDLSFVRVPETASPRLKAYLDRVVPRSVARADHVLVDSQATKDDLVGLYNTPPEKITVLLSGVDARFHRVEHGHDALRRKYNLPDRPFIFTIGTIQPRKNYVRLITALSHLREQGFDLSLVIAGGKGWLDDPIYEAILTHKMDDAVHMIGFANDADLPGLYSAASCLAFPSLYEGFGLPVLEAMACGTPVLTSNVSSLPEVAGDAAITVDPLDQEAITKGLRQIIEDSTLRETLIQKGYQRAAQFTWANAARQLQAVYHSLV